MLKKISAMFVCLAMALSFFSVGASAAGAVVASGSCGENVTYTLYGDGEMVLSGSGEMNTYTAKEPSPFADMDIKKLTVKEGVTGIGDYAFYGCKNLSSVSFPESLTYIGLYSFRYAAFEEVFIPSSVTVFTYNALGDCASLKNIIVDPENPNLTSVDGVLFDKEVSRVIRCPLAKTGVYRIPESVTELGPDSFNGCRYLTEIVLHDNIVRFSYGVFRDCCLITNLYIPKGVAGITAEIFFGCSSLTEFILSSENTYYKEIGGVLFGCWEDMQVLSIVPAGKIGLYEIPEGTTTISGWAFYGTEKLTDITIPSSVSSIGSGIFTHCISLKNVTIPASVTKIGEDIFAGRTDVTIYGAAGSAAESYAAEYGIRFVVPGQVVVGDVNADGWVTAQDSALLLRHLAGWNVRIDLDFADINGDGSVNAVDGVLLKRMLAGWKL